MNLMIFSIQCHEIINSDSRLRNNVIFPNKWIKYTKLNYMKFYFDLYEIFLWIKCNFTYFKKFSTGKCVIPQLVIKLTSNFSPECLEIVHWINCKFPLNVMIMSIEWQKFPNLILHTIFHGIIWNNLLKAIKVSNFLLNSFKKFFHQIPGKSSQ